MGPGPDPVGRVSATYTGRSTHSQVASGDCGSSSRNHWNIVDHLDRAADHELRRPVQSAPHHHRCAVGAPGGGARRSGLGGVGAGSRRAARAALPSGPGIPGSRPAARAPRRWRPGQGICRVAAKASTAAIAATVSVTAAMIRLQGGPSSWGWAPGAPAVSACTCSPSTAAVLDWGAQGTPAGRRDRRRGGDVAHASDPTLHEVGEFAVIDRLVVSRPALDRVSVGPGDDAAVLEAPDGRTCGGQHRHARRRAALPAGLGYPWLRSAAKPLRRTPRTSSRWVPGHQVRRRGRRAQRDPRRPAHRTRRRNVAEAASVGGGMVGGDLVASPQWVVSVTAPG